MARPLPSEAGRPLVIAHRGAKAYKPENTLAAYELAIEQGADMVEIDLHLARDGSVPVAHDASSLSNTSSGSECPSTRSRATLATPEANEDTTSSVLSGIQLPKAMFVGSRMRPPRRKSYT